MVLDRTAPHEELAAAITKADTDLVIDAAGPYDRNGGDEVDYSLALAAIAANSHYLDLADDARFVAEITCLNERAERAGVSVISGASSVPALSSAAVDALISGMRRVKTIDVCILPGNRAPRGRAVMESILGQAGKKFPTFQKGKWVRQTGWGHLARCGLRTPGAAAISNRLASPLFVPDTILFPDHYNAESVTFRAGLELRLMHLGLWLLTFAVRLRLLSSLRPFTGVLWHTANLMQSWGTDRGGMKVEVGGEGEDGASVLRSWTLIAESGDGPQIPPTPAYVLTRKVLDGELPTGARPALGLASLDELQQALSHLDITFART
jgi:hypothetical protein